MQYNCFTNVRFHSSLIILQSLQLWSIMIKWFNKGTDGERFFEACQLGSYRTKSMLNMHCSCCALRVYHILISISTTNVLFYIHPFTQISTGVQAMSCFIHGTGEWQTKVIKQQKLLMAFLPKTLSTFATQNLSGNNGKVD